jgi:hypothetical protein
MGFPEMRWNRERESYLIRGRSITLTLSEIYARNFYV